jgi:tRNA (adenine22-N1)-methyltransferase
MKKVALSERLRAVASFVDKGAAVADVGTDHGYIPVWLIQNGITAAYRLDINRGPG